jgi:Arc/MetJ family transcription regulator
MPSGTKRAACGSTSRATKRATVEFALQELVRRRARRKVLDLQGHVEWDGDLDKSRRSA